MQVKDRIKEERKRSAQEMKVQLAKMRSAAANPSKATGRYEKEKQGDGTRQSLTFPAIKPTSTRNLQLYENAYGPTVKESLLMKEAVEIRDMNWEEKELVLRILFAKMNGLHGQEHARPSMDSLLSAGEEEVGGADPLVFVSEGAGILESEPMEEPVDCDIA